MLPVEARLTPELVLLTILTARIFWAWYFGQEHADKQHGQKLRQQREDIEKVRTRCHNLASEINRLTLQVGVLEERLNNCLRRVNSVERWRHRMDEDTAEPEG